MRKEFSNAPIGVFNNPNYINYVVQYQGDIAKDAELSSKYYITVINDEYAVITMPFDKIINDRYFLSDNPFPSVVYISRYYIYSLEEEVDKESISPIIASNIINFYDKACIMLALKYLFDYVVEKNVPMIIYLPLGTTLGNQKVNGILEDFIDDICNNIGIAVITGVGNEANVGNHASGVISNVGDFTDVDLYVSEEQSFIRAEVWIDNFSDPKYNQIDIAAGGINVKTTGVNNTVVTMNGTCVSAAVVAGASALMFQWAIVEKNDPGIYAQTLKSYLLRGTIKRSNDIYPNPQLGFGILDLVGVFGNLE